LEMVNKRETRFRLRPTGWRGYLLLGFVLWVQLSCTGMVYGFLGVFPKVGAQEGPDIKIGDVTVKEGLYPEFCEMVKDPLTGNMKRNCQARDHLYSNMFTVAVGTASLSTCIWGLIMDRFGPKIIATLGSLMVCFGHGIMWLMIDKSAPYMLNIGLVLVAAGGVGPYISSYNIANVAPDAKVITSFIAALFNMSGLDWLFVYGALYKIGYTGSELRTQMSIIFLAISGANTILIYLLWPVRPFIKGDRVQKLLDFRLYRTRKTPTPSDEENVFKENKTKNDVNCLIPKNVAIKKAGAQLDGTSIMHKVNEAEALLSYKKANYSGQPESPPSDGELTLVSIDLKPDLRDLDAVGQVKSFEFIMITLFYSYFLMCMAFYLGSINTQIANFCEGTSYNADWLQQLALIMANFFPVLIAERIGSVLDQLGFAFGVAAVTTCSMLMFGFILIGTQPTLIASMTLFGVMRCFLFTTYFGYIAAAFGFAHYGQVIGVTTLFAAGICEANLFINHLAFEWGFEYVNMALVIGAAPFLIYALTLGVWEWERFQHLPGFNADVEGSHHSDNLALKREETFGRRLTVGFSRYMGVTPRRMNEALNAYVFTSDGDNRSVVSDGNRVYKFSRNNTQHSVI